MWTMQRDMKRCEDLNPRVDDGSNNAKGYITQRTVIATQRLGTADSTNRREKIDQDNGNGRKIEEYVWTMQRDMKRCEDLNPRVDDGSNNAKGYITQRTVIATQRIGTATRRTGVGDSTNRHCGSTKRHSTRRKDI